MQALHSDLRNPDHSPHGHAELTGHPTHTLRRAFVQKCMLACMLACMHFGVRQVELTHKVTMTNCLAERLSRAWKVKTNPSHLAPKN